MQETTTRRISAAILIDRQGRLLLQQRDDVPGILAPGKIGLFGGHRESHETALDCVVREIAEETSFPFPADRFAPLRQYKGADPYKPSGSLEADLYTLDVRDETLHITEGSLAVVELGQIDQVRAKLTPTAVMGITAYIARL